MLEKDLYQFDLTIFVWNQMKMVENDLYQFGLIIFVWNHMKVVEKFYHLQMMSKKPMNSENYQWTFYVQNELHQLREKKNEIILKYLIVVLPVRFEC